MYSAADCNGHASQWLYQERYPNSHVPHHTTFASSKAAKAALGLCVAYGEGVIAERATRDWYAKFKRGHFGLRDTVLAVHLSSMSDRTNFGRGKFGSNDKEANRENGMSPYCYREVS
ncbi:hypothetical protein TNCV_4546931 [Trichonephila clavipes]|nr:hypothetical protein TNCV_4546931 [Trichonephila clavipes]